MNVRAFRLSDHVEINRLLAESLPEDCYEETSRALARQLSWDSDLVLLAEEDNHLVGIIIGTIDNNKAYYYRIAVLEEYRMRGIGKMLIQTLRQRFVQREVSRILIPLDGFNDAALPFYQSAGCSELVNMTGGKHLRIVE